MSPALVFPAMAAALGAIAACSDLQPIEANRCGNRIVEKGEACDEGGETALCTPECRLACVAADVAPANYVDNPEDSQEDAFCPAGQACGVYGLCAAPSGKFRTAASFEFDVPQAEVGDLDADGVADLVGTGDTEIRVRFGDADGAPLASANHLPAPTATGPFLLANLDNKLGVDLALPSDGGVVPFYATAAGTLRHRPSPTLLFPKEGFIAAVDGVVEMADGPRRPLLVYVEQQGSSAVLRDVVQDGNPVLATCDTGGPATLRVAPLATFSINNGDLLAVGIERAAAPGVCVFVPASPTAPGDPGWTGRFAALAAGARFDAAVNPLVWANLDGDACPELLAPVLTGAGSPGVNRVDDSAANCSFATSTLSVPTWNLGGARILAAGNFDRVGADEIVTNSRVLRVDSMALVTPLGQPLGMDRLRVADFNGDGLPDIAGVNLVQQGEPAPESVRILRTSGPPGNWQASTALVETLRPVAQLAVGDYDGDRIADVALTEVISIDGSRLPTAMAVSVIYGQRSDIPSYQVVLEGDPVVIATLGLRRGGAHDEDGVDDLGVAEVVLGAAKLEASVLYGSAQRALTAPIRTTAVEKVGAIAAGAWSGADPLVDLVVYTDTRKQYVWPQLAGGGFNTSGADTPSPVTPQGLRDFAITNAATTMGSRTVVSFATNNKVAAVGGVGGCPGAWTSTGNLRTFGARPALQARNLDGVAGDELLLTSAPGQNVTSPIQLYPAIASDCKLGQPTLAAMHPLSGCDAAGIIEAGLGPTGEVQRREILAVCRKNELNVLTRFDFAAPGEVTATVLPVKVPIGARRLMVGDFDGDGLEDAITISSVGAVDFATLLLQCATTDASCDP